jgi:transposase
MIQRQGINVDRPRLGARAGPACWWLTPLYELVRGRMLSSDKVFADETTLSMLERGWGKTKAERLCAARRSRYQYDASPDSTLAAD